MIGGAAILTLAALAAGCTPTVRAPGPAVTQPALADDGIRTGDGEVLPLRRWMPNGGEPKAVILALHGFNDYSNFFDEPGMFLASRGIVSYAYDQRGFGAAPHRGVWAGIPAYVGDVKATAALLRHRHPGLPVYLLGESMGGAVVMVAMTGDGPPAIDGIILSAPAVWGRETMPWYQRWALWVGARTVPWLTLTGRQLKIRASDNIEMLRALGRDPLVIKETRVDTIHGLVDLMDAALDASTRLEANGLILYGKHDEVIPKNPTRTMVERLSANGRNNIRVAYYENSYHMLLRDLGAKVLLRDIAHWIDAPGSPLPSGADKQADLLLAKE
ncbi:MAG: alpha/beta hydrolase [Rhodospirillales bacterium]|nr:alpha/beta hydrolase [Rhodospirillales bacterium]